MTTQLPALLREAYDQALMRGVPKLILAFIVALLVICAIIGLVVGVIVGAFLLYLLASNSIVAFLALVVVGIAVAFSFVLYSVLPDDPRKVKFEEPPTP